MPRFKIPPNQNSNDVEDRRNAVYKSPPAFNVQDAVELKPIVTGKPSPAFDMRGRRLQTPEQKIGATPPISVPPKIPIIYPNGMYDGADGNEYDSRDQYMELHHMPMPGSQVDLQQSQPPQKPGIGHRILGIVGPAMQRLGGQQPQPQAMAPPQPAPMAPAPVPPRPMPPTVNPALIRRPMPPQITPPIGGAGPAGTDIQPPMQPGQRPLIRRPMYPGITPAAQNIADEQGDGMPQY